MTFNNLQALSTAAIFASYGRASDIRAAAFQGMAQNMLKTDGKAGFTPGDNVYSLAKVVTVTFTYSGSEFTIQRNLTDDTYSIISIKLNQ